MIALLERQCCICAATIGQSCLFGDERCEDCTALAYERYGVERGIPPVSVVLDRQRPIRRGKISSDNETREYLELFYSK